MKMEHFELEVKHCYVKQAQAVAKLVSFNNAEYVAYELIASDRLSAQALLKELEWQLDESNTNS